MSFTIPGFGSGFTLSFHNEDTQTSYPITSTEWFVFEYFLQDKEDEKLFKAFNQFDKDKTVYHITGDKIIFLFKNEEDYNLFRLWFGQKQDQKTQYFSPMMTFMTTGSTPIPNPVSGTTFYNTSSNSLQFYDGNNWLDLK